MRALCRAVAAVVLAWTMGTVPSCGTMGGGMGHLIDPAVIAESGWM
jgi:hypothetical protein